MEKRNCSHEKELAEFKILIEKMFDCLDKKTKCLEYEDKLLDKWEGLLASKFPDEFWDSTRENSEFGEETQMDEEFISGKKQKFN